MVPGEAQILGQVRAAYEAAAETEARRARRSTGSSARRLRVGKRVRTETAIGESPASVSSAAAELAARVFDDLAGAAILLVGAGKMGELCRGRPDLARRAARSSSPTARSSGRRRSRVGSAVAPSAVDALEAELARGGRRDRVDGLAGARRSARRRSSGRCRRAAAARSSSSTSPCRGISTRRSTSSTAATSTTSTISSGSSRRASPGAATRRSGPRRSSARRQRRVPRWQRSLDVVPGHHLAAARAPRRSGGGARARRGPGSGLIARASGWRSSRSRARS